MLMIKRRTIFSEDRLYRYTLWRDFPENCWFDDIEPDEACAGNGRKFVQFIGLNPSTADEKQDDPTIRRCIGFAKSWGYGALCMTNLFAWRETDSSKLSLVPNPIGFDNDFWLSRISHDAGLVVAAWGTKGQILERQTVVSGFIPNLHCLRKTHGGFPEHPLYLPKTLQPIPF